MNRDQDNEAKKTLVEAHRTSAAHFKICAEYLPTVWHYYFYKIGDPEYDDRNPHCISSENIPEEELEELRTAELSSYAERMISGDLQSSFLHRIGPELAEIFRRKSDAFDSWEDLKESFRKSVEERLRSGLLAEVKALEGVTTSYPGSTRAQRQASFRRRREECEWCRGPFLRNPSRDYYKALLAAHKKGTGLSRACVGMGQSATFLFPQRSDECDNRERRAVKRRQMVTLTISEDDNITAYASAEQAAQGAEAGSISFNSQAALTAVSAEWPASRLIEIWNSIPGNTPVKKFENRNKALVRIWIAIQGLARATVEPAKSVKGVTTAKKAKPTQKPATKEQAAKSAGDRTNKKTEVIALMKRSKGATLAEIVAATNWHAHTVRGFVSILGSKGGEKIESSKNAAGERAYKLAK